jgi:hypothetical protein
MSTCRTTVVGVARLAKYRSLLESREPFFYVPLPSGRFAVESTSPAESVDQAHGDLPSKSANQD